MFRGVSSHAPSTKERRLVAAVQSGDASAAAGLHDALRPSIERALRRVLRSDLAEFEDLVQITFERVIRSLAEETFAGRCSLSTWAYSIAVHVAMDWVRSRATEQRLLEAISVQAVDQHGYSRGFERQLEARAEMRRLQGVLHRMKWVSVKALLLHDVYDHSVPEVARLMGISVSAAESRLRRARVELLRRRGKTVTRSTARADS